MASISFLNFLKSSIKTVHSIAHWNLVWTECVTSSVSRRSLRLAGANSCLINVWVSKICPKLHKFLELSANQVRIGGKLVKKTTYLPAFSQLWERGKSTSTFSELHETTLNETLHPLIPSTWAKSNSKRMFDIKLVSVLHNSVPVLTDIESAKLSTLHPPLQQECFYGTLKK